MASISMELPVQDAMATALLVLMLPTVSAALQVTISPLLALYVQHHALHVQLSPTALVVT